MHDERLQNRADVLTHDEIGRGVEIGWLAIDDDETRAVALGHQRKAGCRPNLQRRTDRQEQIATERQLFGAPHGRLWHRLAERNGRRLDKAAAAWAIGRAAVASVHALA